MLAARPPPTAPPTAATCPLPWLVSVLSGIRAVLCEPIEDARDVHLDLPAANSLKGYATGRHLAVQNGPCLHDNRPMPGPFPQELNTLSRLRLISAKRNFQQRPQVRTRDSHHAQPHVRQ